MRVFNKKALSVVEYAVLFVIIIGAFLIMRNYIQRGIFGTWSKAGQSFAFGRQYDSQKTIECSFDDQSNRWYDHNCFESMYVPSVTNQTCSSGNNICQESIITSCLSSSCGQLNNGASP